VDLFWQNIVIVILVAAAAVYLAIAWVRARRRRRQQPCEDCHCGHRQIHDFTGNSDK